MYIHTDTKVDEIIILNSNRTQIRFLFNRIKDETPSWICNFMDALLSAKTKRNCFEKSLVTKLYNNFIG